MALATARGVRLATYNVGASTDAMFSGPQRLHFVRHKLKGDIAKLFQDGVDVLCLQQISHVRREMVSWLLPGGRGCATDGVTH